MIEKPLIYFLVDSRDVRVAALHKRNIIIRPHVDNIASGPIQVVHGTSNIEIATYATKSLAQYCPMLVGTDFFKKSVYEFARLTFSVVFVANLRGQFCSDKREHHLKRGSSLGNLVNAISKPNHSGDLVEEQLNVFPKLKGEIF